MKAFLRETHREKESYSPGIRAGVFGLVCNAILFAAKFVTGILVGSLAITADAFNNLSDGASSAITVAGYKLAARPADREHPFGHARFEYIAALIVSVIMLVIGALFLKESIAEIFTEKGTPEIRAYVYVVLGLSVAAKGAQAAVYGATYRKTRSLPMRAAAMDSLGDMLATSAAILSAIIGEATGFDADGYFGAAISAFILFTAIRLLKEGVSPLLGAAPPEDLVANIKGKISAYDGVLGVHDMTIHSYGASRVYAIAHIEVSAKETLTAAHELADRIERDILTETGVHLVVHIDPRAEGKSEAAYREMLTAFLSARFPGITVHDFRIVKDGEKDRVFFDAEVPYEAELTEEEIQAALRAFDPAAEYFVSLDRR